MSDRPDTTANAAPVRLPATFRQWRGLTDDERSWWWGFMLEIGVPDPPHRLTWRRQVVPIAADAYGDLGVVLFAVRGFSMRGAPIRDRVRLIRKLGVGHYVAGSCSTMVELKRRPNGIWRGHNPQGGSTDAPFGTRPALMHADVSARSILPEVGPHVATNLVWRLSFCCPREIERVVIRQRSREKEVEIPPHGNFVVVCSTDDRPLISGYGGDGRLVTEEFGCYQSGGVGGEEGSEWF